MSTIASLMVKIGGDITGLTSALAQADTALAKTGKQLETVGKRATLGLSLPIVGAGAMALKAGMDFEAAMSGVTSLMSDAEKQSEKSSHALHDLAIEMGQKTAFGAVDAAKGIEELIKAGVSMDAIVNGGLKGALDLAVAGEINLADAAEIASTALNAFKKDGLSVTQAANILAGAANASATSVGELKYGLSASAAVASAVGMSFQDTATTLAVMAQNGLKGSDAGTSLKTMLMNLIPQTKEQIAMFQKLNLMTEKGTSAFFDNTGKLKSARDIADLLKRSMSGLTEEQRLSASEIMFGSDAIRAATVLYNEGADGIDNMQQAMSNVTAADVAAERMNNLKGSVEQLKGAVETASVKLYEQNEGPLKDFVNWLTNAVTAFSNLNPEVQQWALIIGGVVAVLGPVVLMLGMMANSFSAIGALISPLLPLFASLVGWIMGAGEAIMLWIAGAGTFAEAMLLISNPVGWVIAGILALIAVGALLWAYWEPISKFFVDSWNVIKDATITAWNAIESASVTTWNAIIGFLSGIWSSIAGGFLAAWDGIKSITVSVWSSIMSFFTETIPNGLNTMVNFFAELPSRVGKFLYQLFFEDIPYNIAYGIGFMIQYLTDNIPKVIQFFADLPFVIAGWLVKVSEKFAEWTVVFIKAAIKFGGDVLDGIVWFFTQLPVDIAKWLADVTTRFSTWATDLVIKAGVASWDFFNKMIDVISTLPAEVGSWLLKVFDKLTNFAVDALDAAKKIGSAIFDGIVDFIKSIPQKIDDLLGGIVGKVMSIANSIKGAIASVFSSGSAGLEAGKNAASNASSVTATADVVPHAEGGVFTKPTMIGNHLFGEKGPEALIPLNQYGGFNNNNGGGEKQPIIIYLGNEKIFEGFDNYLGSRMNALGAV